LLVDDEQTSPETSGTAMILRAILRAQRRNWLARDGRLDAACARAVDFLTAAASTDGEVNQGCPGTGLIDTRRAWRSVPLRRDEPHAIAAVIDALTEAHLADEEAERDT
jgi:rhamnogalacturonyl hydrolase YesR